MVKPCQYLLESCFYVKKAYKNSPTTLNDEAVFQLALHHFAADKEFNGDIVVGKIPVPVLDSCKTRVLLIRAFFLQNDCGAHDQNKRGEWHDN